MLLRMLYSSAHSLIAKTWAWTMQLVFIPSDLSDSENYFLSVLELLSVTVTVYLIM